MIGVILERFDEIKLGIKNLALEELFTKDKIEKYLLNKMTMDEVNNVKN